MLFASEIHGVYLQPDHTGQPSALPQGRAPERAVSGVFLLFCPEVSGDRSEKYGKPVVVIIAATAQSHTEYCVQCMQVDPGVTVIGTQSAGTNGNVSEFVLPGGIRSCFPAWTGIIPAAGVCRGWKSGLTSKWSRRSAASGREGTKRGKRPSKQSTAAFRGTEEERGYSPAGALTEGRISSAEAPHFRLGRLPILSTRVPPSMMSSWLIQHFV